MTIYLDIVFFENIAMNFLILMATGIISRYKINSFKLLISGALGRTVFNCNIFCKTFYIWKYIT